MAIESGIYSIEHLKSGRRYIGSSSNISVRFTNHKSCLRRGTHDNSYLQHSWDKHGGSGFKFVIVEKCDVGKLIDREQFWIEYYNSCDRRNGYNICPRADRRFHSDETKKKMSIKRQGRTPNYKHGLSGTSKYRLGYARNYYKAHRKKMIRQNVINKRIRGLKANESKH